MADVQERSEPEPGGETPPALAEITVPTPPGPGEPGFDKMAVPKYILELIHQGQQEQQIVEQVKLRYPYSKVNIRHVAWMSAAQKFADLDPQQFQDHE